MHYSRQKLTHIYVGLTLTLSSVSDDWTGVVFVQICPVEHTVTDWRNWPTPGVETKETRLTSVRLGAWVRVCF